MTLLSADVAPYIVTVGATEPTGPFIDWPTFWTKDRSGRDWLIDDVLARGRAHALYAKHKTGKSLLTLALVAKLVVEEPGVVVVYLDYEMTEDDLLQRLEDFGYGPETDFARLRYALLPNLPPLDTEAGAAGLLGLVDSVQVEYPGHHLAVVFDTTSRAVHGDENDADTIRDFYRFTGVALKARGATCLRIDHAGKNTARGQRGSSAKGDDVDVVWRLEATENGVALVREATRLGWIPARVVFRHLDHPLRFVRVEEDCPLGTEEIVERLDRLGVDPKAGERPAGKALRTDGRQASNAVVRAAQRVRRKREEFRRTGLE